MLGSNSNKEKKQFSTVDIIQMASAQSLRTAVETLDEKEEQFTTSLRAKINDTLLNLYPQSTQEQRDEITQLFEQNIPKRISVENFVLFNPAVVMMEILRLMESFKLIRFNEEGRAHTWDVPKLEMLFQTVNVQISAYYESIHKHLMDVLGVPEEDRPTLPKRENDENNDATPH